MDDNTVKVIVKGDVLDSATWAKKKYSNLFDRQRLILKSLYDIRRCRINNRDVSIVIFFIFGKSLNWFKTTRKI